MDILEQTIAEIQEAYSGETDPLVFADLLEREKRGKKRKVLKRWLKGVIKSLEGPEPVLSPSSIDPSVSTFVKTPKDKITGIPIIG